MPSHHATKVWVYLSQDSISKVVELLFMVTYVHMIDIFSKFNFYSAT